MDRCDECGFEYDLAHAENAAASIISGAAQFTAVLRDGGIDLTHRREPTCWSPLEYGCHLRDVLLVQRERVLAARRREKPSFDAMGRDERVDHDGYAEQETADVARQLTMAAQLFANVLNRLLPDDWDRIVVYNYPRKAERSLRWVALHTVHEVTHHLLDAQRQIAETLHLRSLMPRL
jgi:DinB superfamily